MNRSYKLTIITLTFLSLIGLNAQEKGKADEFQLYKTDTSITVKTASSIAVENWKDQRFGMFIHWGPISQMGVQLSHSRNSPSHIPGAKPYKKSFLEPEVYDVQYKTFNPIKFNPEAIIDLAQKAGMTYLVFTAKHHAGFSMFDSKVSDYDSMNTPYKKDILKELEQACRKKDFNFGFYYSPRDWYNLDCDSENNHPKYIEFYKSQMEELLHNYGSISEIWFDGLGPGDWGNTSEVIMRRIRELHPDAMVNDRGGVGADFYTPEHTISQFNNKQNWEACHTTTGQWGYNPKVGTKSIASLMEILLYTWGSDGNMLLNIGPRGDGSLNPIEVERLEQIADWWSVNGDISIRSSRGGPYLPGPWGVSTRKENNVYLHVFRWSKNNEIILPNLPNKNIKSVKLLNGKAITYTQNTTNFRLSIDKQNRGQIVTSIELELESSAMDLEPLYAIKPLTLDAELTASNNQEELKHIFDADASTIWHAKKDANGEIWIEADFKNPVTIGSIVTGRGDQWHPKHTPELQIPDENGTWKTIFSWKPKFETVKFLKEPITTNKVRLKITGAPVYYLAELELYAPL